eukprot:scaffold59446_cov70-Phaeocystis_antarctica.AAC.1
MWASRSAQFSVRTSRSGASASSCVTDTWRSTVLTRTCETPGRTPSFLCTSATSEWQHMP